MAIARKQSWNLINLNTEAGSDSLLGCLVLMTRYNNNPFSAKALVARLPLVKECLTEDIFPRSAQRAGLEAEKITLRPEDFGFQDEPLILSLSDGQYVLLIRDEHNEMKILDPLKPEELNEPQAILDKFAGEAISVTPMFQTSARAEESLEKAPRNWFWKVVYKSWPLYSEVLMASFLVNIFALVIPLFTMNVYDRVVPNKAMDTLWVLASGVIIIFVFDILLKALRAYFIDEASKHSDLELSAIIYQHVLGLKMTHRPKSVGSLANTVQSFEVFRDFITSTTMTIFVDLPFVGIFLMVIFFIGGNLVWIPFLVIPFILLMGILVQLPLIKLTRQSYQHSAEKQATLIESLSAIEAVKTTGAESVLQSRWEQIIKEASKTNMKLRMIANSSINITGLSQQIATIGLVIAGVYKISEGDLTVGGLIACTILTSRALAPMGQVAGIFTRYFQSINALKSLDKIMQLSTDIDEAEKYLHRPSLQGNVQFKQVEFNYQDEKVSALKNVNFSIRSGEKVALIGKIGSGKSTIARMIMRLYEPTKGHIFLDNTDYRQINPDDLRQQIGYVPQDVTLFYGSIRDNITIGAPFVSDKTILQAAEIAGVTQFTNQHPDGFDRQVGEKGQALSGGQRQSIALARALLLQPHLLVLDEPTASMDDLNERLFKTKLAKHMGPNDTLIIITHKLSMLDLVDRIIVIDDGKVYADGAKEAVLNALRSGTASQQTRRQANE